MPNIHRNFVSIPVLYQKHYKMELKSETVIISKNDLLVKGVESHNIYVLTIEINKVLNFIYLNVSNNRTYLCMLRLGQINKK